MAKALSKLRDKRLDTLLLTIIYTVAGVANALLSAMSNFTFMLAGAFAVLSFIAAYGFFTTKKWAVWIAISLFFPVATFAILTLYFSVRLSGGFYPSVDILFFHLSFLFYIVLSFISFVYVTAKRNTFQ